MFSQTKIFCLLFVFCVSFIGLTGCDTDLKVEKTKMSSSSTESKEAPESGGDADADKPTEDAAAETKPAETSPAPKVDAAVADEGFEVSVGEGGALIFKAPAAWKKVKPSSSFVEYEISVPKSDGEDEDAADGRLTMMGAMGSVDANIQRWYGQYTQPDGSKTEDNSTVTESKVAGCDVMLVDIKGTLMDRPGGPMAGGDIVERENYRMLASIIQAGEHGQYFVKLYGPAKTIADNEAAFKAFVESLTIDSEKKGL